mgnify:CR=1 FL=1
MKTIVAGNPGFIGSNLAEELARKGHEVVIRDELSTGKEKNIQELKDNGKFVRGGITNFGVLNNCLEVSMVFFHHAAILSVQGAVEDSLTTNEVNVKGREERC